MSLSDVHCPPFSRGASAFPTAHLDRIYRVLKKEYERRNAPVSRLVEQRRATPYRVLVTAMLSTRTQDETTLRAAQRLFRHAPTLDALRKLSAARIRTLIYPVGFYRQKARFIRQLPTVLDELFGGRIPDRVEDLCKLPGVGRKVATLVSADAFGHATICVDVHVHRISNRLGLVATRTPRETEQALATVLPRRYWKHWNLYLVSHGQTVCRPLRPRCAVCAISRWCRSIASLPRSK